MTMDLLQDIQRKLDTHLWGEVMYAYYTVDGKLEKQLPYRQCVRCQAYNEPNSINECSAQKAGA